MKAKYITPAVTVFSEDGSIHFEEQGKVYEHLIAGGVEMCIRDRHYGGT